MEQTLGTWFLIASLLINALFVYSLLANYSAKKSAWKKLAEWSEEEQFRNTMQTRLDEYCSQG
jgi:hypothetical protein